MASRAPAAAKSGESDDEIVSRFQLTGNQDDFAELVGRYGDKVYRKCFRFFSNEQLAREASQDAFCLAFTGIQRYTAGNFQAWLLQIATNACINNLRKTKMESEIELLDSTKHFSRDSSAETKSFVQQVWAELETLPLEQRQCMKLKIEGYSYEETAKILGISVKAVKSHLQNGRRTMWIKFGGLFE